MPLEFPLESQIKPGSRSGEVCAAAAAGAHLAPSESIYPSLSLPLQERSRPIVRTREWVGAKGCECESSNVITLAQVKTG